MTPEQRFWIKVDKTETCWLWAACIDSKGYGRFSLHCASAYAHRFVFELTVGPVPAGHVLDHKCRVRHCVRPDHLQVVTPQQNNENRGPQPGSSSGVRGVHWDRVNQKWRVGVAQGGRHYHGRRWVDLADAEAEAIAMRSRLMTNNLPDLEVAS